MGRPPAAVARGPAGSLSLWSPARRRHGINPSVRSGLRNHAGARNRGPDSLVDVDFVEQTRADSSAMRALRVRPHAVPRAHLTLRVENRFSIRALASAGHGGAQAHPEGAPLPPSAPPRSAPSAAPMPLQGDAGTHRERRASRSWGRSPRARRRGSRRGPSMGTTCSRGRPRSRATCAPAPRAPSLALPFRPLAAPSALRRAAPADLAGWGLLCARRRGRSGRGAPSR